jgi:hypothetical protein
MIAVAREPETSDCGSKTGWKKNRLGIGGNVGLRDYSTLGSYAV